MQNNKASAKLSFFTVLEMFVSAITPLFWSSALHFFIIRPYALFFYIKNATIKHYIIFALLSMPPISVLSNYYSDADFGCVLILLYFYLGLVFFDIGIAQSKISIWISKYAVTSLVLLLVIQVIVWWCSQISYEFTEFLVSRGVEPTRISFGNALESQITITLLSYAYLIRNKKNNKLCAWVVMFSNAIAQTRILIILSGMILIRAYNKNASIFKVVLGSVFGLAFLMLLGVVLNVDRLNLQDLFTGGSTSDRIELINIFFDLINPEYILFGAGAGSFASHYETVYGVRKSVESILFQILYEFGLFGFSIVIASLAATIKKYNLVITLESAVFIFQILIMMPINAMLPLQLLLLGRCLSPSTKF